MSNQRQFYRLPKQFDAEYALLKWGEESTLAGTTKNVSATGILLESPTALELGTLLKVRFNVTGIQKYKTGFLKPGEPETQPLVVLGRVVRVEEIEDRKFYDIGVIFINIDPDDQQALMSYIEDKRRIAALTEKEEKE